MGKGTKNHLVGYYTHPKMDGRVEIRVPSNYRLPLWLDILPKGKDKTMHFWLVKQKVVK